MVLKVTKIQKLFTLDLEVVNWLSNKDNQSGYLNELLLIEMKKSLTKEDILKQKQEEFLKSKEEYDKEMKKLQESREKAIEAERLKQEKILADEREAREIERKKIVELVENNNDLAEDMLSDSPLQLIYDMDKLLDYVNQFRIAGNSNVGIATLQKYIKIKLGVED